MDEKKERWMELCEQAAGETDSEKLQVMVKEIDRLLKEKHDHFEGPQAPSSSAA